MTDPAAPPPRPGRPLVLVPGAFVAPEHLPRGPAQTHRLGVELGWDARAGLGLSRAIDTKHVGPDGHWDRPLFETRREPQHEDDGSPVLTPTGAAKLAAARQADPTALVDPAWISARKVPTDVPVWVEWIAVQLRRGDALVHASWERPSTGNGTWTPQGALVPGHGRLDITATERWLRAQG